MTVLFSQEWSVDFFQTTLLFGLKLLVVVEPQAVSLTVVHFSPDLRLNIKKAFDKVNTFIELLHDSYDFKSKFVSVSISYFDLGVSLKP